MLEQQRHVNNVGQHMIRQKSYSKLTQPQTGSLGYSLNISIDLLLSVPEIT